MNGGTSDDTYLVNDAGDVITEFSGQGIDTVDTTLTNYALAANIESLAYTGAGNFSGIGNNLVNVGYPLVAVAVL